MEKKSQDFSMEKARQLANSSAGQELFQLLQGQDQEAIRLAQQQAAAGSYEQAGQTLQSLLSSPQIQALIKRLGG